VPPGGPGSPAIVVAAGAGYGLGYAANTHQHLPDGWMPTMKYLVEELGHDVNARDARGFTPLHFAAARGDDEMIHYLVDKGADVTAVARTGQTTADMANGPFQRISPYLGTVALLESLGSKNNHRCLSC
jgi:ankyrin repeat protein